MTLKPGEVESNFNSSQGSAMQHEQNFRGVERPEYAKRRKNVTNFRVDQNMFYIVLIAKKLKKSFSFDLFLRTN